MAILGHDLTPEYQVTTGRRRISAQQEVPLRQLGMFTPEVIDRQKWFAFWDVDYLPLRQAELKYYNK